MHVYDRSFMVDILRNLIGQFKCQEYTKINFLKKKYD